MDGGEEGEEGVDWWGGKKGRREEVCELVKEGIGGGKVCMY